MNEGRPELSPLIPISYPETVTPLISEGKTWGEEGIERVRMEPHPFAVDG
jgi:hypothetical protein